MKRLTIPAIRKAKGGTPLVMLTAYTVRTAQLLDPHCDVLLVGDSLGQVAYGLPSPVPVTPAIMAAPGAPVVRDARIPKQRRRRAGLMACRDHNVDMRSRRLVRGRRCAPGGRRVRRFRAARCGHDGGPAGEPETGRDHGRPAARSPGPALAVLPVAIASFPSSRQACSAAAALSPVFTCLPTRGMRLSTCS